MLSDDDFSKILISIENADSKLDFRGQQLNRMSPKQFSDFLNALKHKATQKDQSSEIVEIDLSDNDFLATPDFGINYYSPGTLSGEKNLLARILAVLNDFPNVKLLNLNKTMISNGRVWDQQTVNAIFGCVSKFQNLEELNLSHNKLADLHGWYNTSFMFEKHAIASTCLQLTSLRRLQITDVEFSLGSSTWPTQAKVWSSMLTVLLTKIKSLEELNLSNTYFHLDTQMETNVKRLIVSNCGHLICDSLKLLIHKNHILVDIRNTTLYFERVHSHESSKVYAQYKNLRSIAALKDCELYVDIDKIKDFIEFVLKYLIEVIKELFSKGNVRSISGSINDLEKLQLPKQNNALLARILFTIYRAAIIAKIDLSYFETFNKIKNLLIEVVNYFLEKNLIADIEVALQPFIALDARLANILEYFKIFNKDKLTIGIEHIKPFLVNDNVENFQKIDIKLLMVNTASTDLLVNNLRQLQWLQTKFGFEIICDQNDLALILQKLQKLFEFLSKMKEAGNLVFEKSLKDRCFFLFELALKIEAYEEVCAALLAIPYTSFYFVEARSKLFETMYMAYRNSEISAVDAFNETFKYCLDEKGDIITLTADVQKVFDHALLLALGRKNTFGINLSSQQRLFAFSKFKLEQHLPTLQEKNQKTIAEGLVPIDWETNRNTLFSYAKKQPETLQEIRFEKHQQYLQHSIILNARAIKTLSGMFSRIKLIWVDKAENFPEHAKFELEIYEHAQGELKNLCKALPSLLETLSIDNKQIQIYINNIEKLIDHIQQDLVNNLGDANYGNRFNANQNIVQEIAKLQKSVENILVEKKDQLYAELEPTATCQLN